MAETSSKIMIISRDTYNTRKNNNELDNNILYIVIEDVEVSEKCLSMYLGTSKQTDLINIRDTLHIDSSSDFDLSKLSEKGFKVKDKLLMYENTKTGLAELYTYSQAAGDKHIPIAGCITWQEL